MQVQLDPTHELRYILDMTKPYMDDTTGLYFAQARYYDSGVARFVSEDPIVAGQNWYGYCGNSPLSYRDPMGWDAIVVTQTKEVAGMGHLGALIEDNNGDWNFFYWGTDVKLERIDDPAIVQSPEMLNEYLAEKGWLGKNNLPYDGFTYIPGDFSKTLAKYDDVKREHDGIKSSLSSWDAIKCSVQSFVTGETTTNSKYDLFLRNCSQETVKHLGLGILPGGVTVDEYIISNSWIKATSTCIPNHQLVMLQFIFYNDAFTKEGFNASVQDFIKRYTDPNRFEDVVINKEYYERHLAHIKQITECPVD